MQCADPPTVAQRWAEIVELPLSTDLTLALDNVTVRFVEYSDGRPEGSSEIDIAANDVPAILAAAEKRDARCGDKQIYLCGARQSRLRKTAPRLILI